MRKNRTRDEWMSLFREQESSGLPAADFCRREQINPNVFYRKRREYGANRFVRLPVPGGNGCGITIRIGEVIIEPGTCFQQEELKRIIQSVKEVYNAHLQ